MTCLIRPHDWVDSVDTLTHKRRGRTCQRCRKKQRFAVELSRGVGKGVVE